MPNTTLDMKALNNSVQQAVVPLFWGGLLLAVLLPVAAAGGSWVVEKVTGGSNRERK